jgi:uncharacterized small protein (DUF1192 family)
MSENIKEAKLNAISIHIKNIKADRYKAQMSLLLENALSIQYPERIAFLESEISRCSSQIAGLEAQYASVESE